MWKERVKVGEFEGQPILYDPKAKKFEITLLEKGLLRAFRASSEIALRKQIREARETPPIEAMDTGWYWNIPSPTKLHVIISGERLYAVNGRKTRISNWDSDHVKRYDAKIFKELEDIFQQAHKLQKRWESLVRKLKPIREA